MDNQASGIYDVIVLGAGISGLVASSVMQENGCNKILVLEKYINVGGNHIDVSIGNYTFDIGSLIFQDDSPLLRHFPEILPKYIEVNPVWQRLNPQGVVTRYPISIKDDIVVAGPVEWLHIGASIIISRLFNRKMSNARDFAKYWIGDRFLKRSGLENYMTRFYGLPPREIDLKFAQKRMTWVSEYASHKNPMLKIRKKNRPAPSNRQLVRPREGFNCLYEPAIDKLMQRGADISLNTDVLNVKRVNGLFEVQTDKGSFETRRLVSTLPINESLRICNLPVKETLKSVCLISLFYSFKGARGFPASILYNFSFDGTWKRLTVYSDFYNIVDGREYFGVEVNADHVSGSSSIADSDFREHVAANGLFNGDLILEGCRMTSNAYPIYVDGAEELAQEAVVALSNFGVESIGRQGRFDYQPTARETTLKAEMALKPDL